MVKAVPDVLYAPNRIKSPMIRQSFYRDRSRSDRTKHGAEPFVRVSWGEALNIVAEELRRVTRQHGNRVIYGGSYGWQSAGRFHGASQAVQRLLNLLGGYVSYVKHVQRAGAPGDHAARPGGPAAAGLRVADDRRA
jgi:biotin/methionine sulfoxide reductase